MKNAVLTLAVLVLSISSIAYGAEGLKRGANAPNIIGRTLDDTLFRLKSAGRRPKIINFFWVGCAPCQKEMPELAILEKKNPRALFFSVHTKAVGKKAVSDFIKSLKGAPKTIVLGSTRVTELYNFTGLPHTVILNSRNEVIKTFSGYTKKNMNALKKILSDIQR